MYMWYMSRDTRVIGLLRSAMHGHCIWFCFLATLLITLMDYNSTTSFWPPSSRPCVWPSRAHDALAPCPCAPSRCSP